MSLTISIRFLTGRAHLHPWQTHHSEGRVEWPPSPWRLLRALVAVAGRGLTRLPYPDFVSAPPEQPAPGRRRGKKQATALEDLTIDYWQVQHDDCIQINRLSQLLYALSAPPTIWVPKTSGGHTRQYFPIHDAGTVKSTGSAVFDTFATVRKDQPLLFHWPNLQLDEPQRADLKLLLGRMTYFGRAESWCRAEMHLCTPEEIQAEEISRIVLGHTHWECACIEDQGSPPGQKEYRDYLLERRLAPVSNLKNEVSDLLPRTKGPDGTDRKNAESLKTILQAEPAERILLRCLLRESGQDIKDGLERPIGTRWIHYAVPRPVHDIPRPAVQPRLHPHEPVNLVVYALNTATIHRPVLPSLTDTLLVADRFRSAAMALARNPGRALSGHEENGDYCRDHNHAFWWPTDEDTDGLLDHVTVYARAGFEGHEVDALRRLTRLRQRGGRPDLLVTPIFVGRDGDYKPWQQAYQCTKLFVSATPYFCPVSLARGRNSRSSRPHSIKKDIRKRLRQQQLIDHDDDVEVQELVFDYAPSEFLAVQQAVANGEIHQPVPPRQYFPVIDPPAVYAELPKSANFVTQRGRYEGCLEKEPDESFTFGLSSGLYVAGGTRFVRSLAFCRRRRNHDVRGPGRMFCLKFREVRSRRPFAIGDQCHFGLGLFVPTAQKEDAMF